MSDLSNQQIARVLQEMSALYAMHDVKFKPRAYQKAAEAIETMSQSIADLYEQEGKDALTEISGVGEAIADHIEELIKTGTFEEYKDMKSQIPVKIDSLLKVEGLGPQTIKTLWEKLKVQDLEDLEQAARAGKVRQVAGFGPKSEAKLLKGIEFLKKSGGRFLLGFVYDEIMELERTIARWPETGQVKIAGSVRRMQATIGDIDILATAKQPAQVMERFLGLPQIDHVYGHGETKTNVRLTNGLDADLRVVPARSWGAALNYFTGGKNHNIALRELALKHKWKLSEYGLFRGKTQIAGKTEAELYKKLGLPYIEPELRERQGELEAARAGKLPDLVGYDDLQGDLQVQTDWTDGKNTIEEYAAAAMKRGLGYLAITDHTRGLPMTRGSDEQRLQEQMEVIDKLNAKLARPDFRLLKGAEVNIQKDGRLDIDDATLARLEVVGAAVHHHFNLSRREQTRRLIRAMENPHVDIIFHLTARRIQRREPIQLDIEAMIRAARATGTVLEIDSFADRLDIHDQYIRRCVAAGVKMAIDSDAHSIRHFDWLQFGIGQARRGWAARDDIINAWPVDKMLSMLK